MLALTEVEGTLVVRCPPCGTAQRHVIKTITPHVVRLPLLSSAGRLGGGTNSHKPLGQRGPRTGPGGPGAAQGGTGEGRKAGGGGSGNGGGSTVGDGPMGEGPGNGPEGIGAARGTR